MVSNIPEARIWPTVCQDLFFSSKIGVLVLNPVRIKKKTIKKLPKKIQKSGRGGLCVGDLAHRPIIH